MPRYDNRSARFEVISTSKIVSPGRYSEKIWPTGASAGQDQQTIRILRQRQLLGRAKHALRKLAPQFGFLDYEPTEKLCPRQCQRSLVAILIILRSANDLPNALAILDLADPQAVRIWMLDGRKNTRNDHMGALHSSCRNLFHFRAGKSQLFQHHGYRNVEINIPAQPAKRKFHKAKE